MRIRAFLVIFHFLLLWPVTDASARVLRHAFAGQGYTFQDANIDVALKIVGDISVGTLQDLVAAHEGILVDGGSPILLLDSYGGSVDEALKIANFVSANGLSTMVDANALCLSACAIVFMAGREPPYEGPGAVSRYLHIKGRLGFHAPYLGYEKSQLSERFEGTYGDILRAYQAGLHQVGEMLLGPGTTGAKWPPSLVGEMLLTNPDKFREIVTIDDAGRWGIELVGFGDADPPADPATNYVTCMNYLRWRDEEVWHEYSGFDFAEPSTASGWAEQQETGRNSALQAYITTIPVDGMNGISCYVAIYDGDNIRWISTNEDMSDEQRITRAMMLPPDTMITRILPAK